MNQKIELQTYASSFSERTTHYLFMGLIATCGFVVVFWFSGHLDNTLALLACCSLVWFYTGYSIWKGRVYLIGFKSDSQKVEVRYLDRKIVRICETTFENMEVELRNTTSRSGFNCEVILKVDGLKLTMDKDFDWTFSDMKDLFEYVRHFQQIPLAYEEKFTLRVIEEKIKKRLTQPD